MFPASDLSQTGPSCIGREPCAGRKAADLDTCRSLVHCLSCEQSGLDFPKACFGVFWCKSSGVHFPGCARWVICPNQTRALCLRDPLRPDPTLPVVRGQPRALPTPYLHQRVPMIARPFGNFHRALTSPPLRQHTTHQPRCPAIALPFGLPHFRPLASPILHMASIELQALRLDVPCLAPALRHPSAASVFCLSPLAILPTRICFFSLGHATSV